MQSQSLPPPPPYSCPALSVSCTNQSSLSVSLAAPAPATDAPADTAQRCDTEACQLPYCFCSKDGTQIPGGLDAEKVSVTRLLYLPPSPLHL